MNYSHVTLTLSGNASIVSLFETTVERYAATARYLQAKQKMTLFSSALGINAESVPEHRRTSTYTPTKVYRVSKSFFFLHPIIFLHYIPSLSLLAMEQCNLVEQDRYCKPFIVRVAFFLFASGVFIPDFI